MISRERFEELLNDDEQKFYLITTIVDNNSNVPRKEIKEYKNLKEFAYLILSAIDNIEENSFETKEEAEWNLEFGDITRTETLNLPSWEKAKNGIEYKFYAPKGNIYFLSTKIKVGYSIDKENPYIIRVERMGYSDSNQDFEFTKENYIEACRIAKKLFLGKEG